MLDDLALVLRQQQIHIYDREVIDQLKSFIITKRGRAQAESNKHDDLVMATAGAYQLLILVPTKQPDEFSREEWKQEQDKWRFR